jgi:hypothetical protein
MRSVSRRLLPLATVAAILLGAPLAAQQKVTVPAKDNVLAGQPVPVWAVGTDEGESWEMLSNVQVVAFDRQDNLYVLDSGNYRVLVFDKGGKFQRQIGKQGNGPGELTFPTGMAVAPDGNIVVGDMGRGGYTVFRGDGTYVENIAGVENMRVGPGGLYLDASGAVIFRAMPALNRFDGAPPPGSIPSPIVRHTLARAASPSTLYEVPMPAPKIQDSPARGGGAARMVMFVPQTFAPPITWTGLPNGGIAVSHDAEYAIKIVDPNGTVQRVVARTDQPRKVTRRDQERAKEQRRKQLSSRSSGGGIRVTNADGRMSYGFGGRENLSNDQIEEQLRSMTFADVMPMVQTVRSDPLGRLWVQRVGKEVGDAGSIDLFAGDGRYIGTIAGHELPDAVSSSGLAAYIERDDLDVQRVAVRRLPPAWMQGVTGAGRPGQ